MEMQIILGPLVGAVIGYITNGIAIKMLFRPMTPKYLFGRRLPFTPGLIPKERFRLSKSLGDTISANLMNKEILGKTLLSDDMNARIESAIDGFIEEQAHNPQTLREFLYGLLSKDEVDAAIKSGADDLSALLHHKLSDAQFGRHISHIVVQHALQKVHDGFLGKVGADKLLALVASSAEEQLSKNINRLVRDNSQQLVGDLLEQETDKLLSMQMCVLVADRQHQIGKLKEYALSSYRKTVINYLPKALDTLNISKIIESRINEMDFNEVETLIYEVMNRELKAIVWLGALLGFIMGFINVF
jgi:uncharacterized membrane protein YheB (UPF0754 family)